MIYKKDCSILDEKNYLDNLEKKDRCAYARASTLRSAYEKVINSPIYFGNPDKIKSVAQSMNNRLFGEIKMLQEMIGADFSKIQDCPKKELVEYQSQYRFFLEKILFTLSRNITYKFDRNGLIDQGFKVRTDQLRSMVIEASKEIGLEDYILSPDFNYSLNSSVVVHHGDNEAKKTSKVADLSSEDAKQFFEMQRDLLDEERIEGSKSRELRIGGFVKKTVNYFVKNMDYAHIDAFKPGFVKKFISMILMIAVDEYFNISNKKFSTDAVEVGIQVNKEFQEAGVVNETTFFAEGKVA